MNDYEFGNRLYALRKRCKMSQAELGQLVNVSDKAVSKWETGKSKPGIDIMNKFAELCASVGQIDKKPEVNGRNIFMFLAPISNKK